MNQIEICEMKNFVVPTRFIIVCIFICSNAIAQTSNTIDLQNNLSEVINSKEAKLAGITGIPLTFQCDGINGKQPISLAVGKIDKNSDADNLPKDTIYQIGSSSKSFVAVVALQMEAEGLFGQKGLDISIGELLHDKGLAESSVWIYKWNKITLRELLNHTSGIPDYTDDKFTEFSEMYLKYPYRQVYSNEIIKLMADEPIDFSAGKGWHYSNTGYVILGEIIAIITKSSIKQQIISRVIDKLALTHTYYITNIESHEISPSQIKLLMSGYINDDQFKKFSLFKDDNNPVHSGVNIVPFSLSWANAAGSIISDTIDMNKYVQALFRDKAHGGLLESQQLSEMKSLVATESSEQYNSGAKLYNVDKKTTTGFGLGYGLGIMAFFTRLPDGRSITYYSHGGDTLGFHSNWIYIEDRHASAVYVFNSNKSGYWMVRQNIESAILSKMMNECLVN